MVMVYKFLVIQPFILLIVGLAVDVWVVVRRGHGPWPTGVVAFRSYALQGSWSTEVIAFRGRGCGGQGS